MAHIVFDLETAGLPNAQDYYDLPERDTSPVTPDKRLTDPVKIEASIAGRLAEREEEYLKKVAALKDKESLDYNVGRIVALGWWMERGEEIRVLRTEGDERLALEDFWSCAKHRILVGYNIKAFDLRYLIQRSRFLGVDYPRLDLGKYGKGGVIDLFLELTFNDGHYDNGAMRRTLQAFARRIGLPVDDTLTGADVPRLVAEGRWDEIAAHCGSDLRLTLGLARWLGVVPAEAPALEF